MDDNATFLPQYRLRATIVLHNLSPVAGSGRRRLRWRSVLLSLWAAWLIATFADAATIFGAGYVHRWNHIPNAIFNFFTPILIGNFDLKRPAIFPLMFGVLLIGDLAGGKIRWPAVRVMYNLLVLAALTAAIDLIVQGSWLSFHFLRDAMQGF